MDLKYLPQQQNSEHYVEGEVLEQGAFMETTGNHSFQVVGGESLPHLTPQPPFCQSQWGSFIQCFLELYPAGWQCTFVRFPPAPPSLVFCVLPQPVLQSLTEWGRNRGSRLWEVLNDRPRIWHLQGVSVSVFYHFKTQWEIF